MNKRLLVFLATLFVGGCAWIYLTVERWEADTGWMSVGTDG